MRVKFRHPRSQDPPIWWRCDPSATFAECKAAADRLLSSLPPHAHAPYSLDLFKRARDGLLWDPRYGKRVYGQLKYKPAECVGDVFHEGDEIICVAHLHKRWSVTCNALSESRFAVLDKQRQRAADSTRDAIVKQATKEHFTLSKKVQPTRFNEWKAPTPIGGVSRNLNRTGVTKVKTSPWFQETSRKSATASEVASEPSSKSASSGTKSGSGKALAARN
jgi:predicted nucleic acid-binding Zn ribbon protein|mmetsp:Transcript_11472/g.42512  ORF Transcript_11472/g.42512 Transcript_11472/m.42512 type:complete len:220 (-) Transcript_11472:2026-2685(-)